MRTLPDKVSILDLTGSQVEVDEAGYLFDPSEWSPEFARLMAAQEKIELSKVHWQVFDFMRLYYEEHGIAADARWTIKFIAEQQTLSKLDAKHELFELFPGGYVKQACKLSGMRQPRAWSTG